MKLLVASPIDADALAALERDHDVVVAFGASEDVLRQLVVDREAIIFRSGVDISRSVLEAGSELRALVRAGSGLDNLDLDYAAQRGIVLERVPGPGAQSVAEMTLGLMLALARNIVVADGLMRQGRWAKTQMMGHLLQGKTLGIVGLGNIGLHVARLALAWQMRVVACVARPSPSRASKLSDEGIELTDCDEVLRRGDFVTIHVPLTPETRNLIDGSALATMKPGAFLVNIARGGVVDEAALHADLAAGDHLAGAALDVHEQEGEGRLSPLHALPNVVLTPHIGASTFDSQRQIGEEVRRIIERFDTSTARPG